MIVHVPSCHRAVWNRLRTKQVDDVQPTLNEFIERSEHGLMKAARRLTCKKVDVLAVWTPAGGCQYDGDSMISWQKIKRDPSMGYLSHHGRRNVTARCQLVRGQSLLPGEGPGVALNNFEQCPAKSIPG
jgi:hypothetical protein